MTPKTWARVAGAAVAVAVCTATTSCSSDAAPLPSSSSSASVTSAASGTTSDAGPTSESPLASEPPAAMRWGVTIDDVHDLEGVLASLKALPSRPTARIVLDSGQNPSDYADAITELHSVADVMAEPVDSYDAKKYTLDEYRTRFQSYLAAWGSQVSIWEIGNEVNGEWTGSSQDSAAKSEAAFDQVHAAGKPTALTLYYNPDCWSDESHAMLAWAERWIPSRMKQGLDYVFVSYYEKDCDNHRPDPAEWKQVFGQLRSMFPAARLGFGEVGTDQHADPAAKAAYLTRYYTMASPVSGYVGGYFWWYYAEDAVPYARSPVWAALRAAMETASSKGQPEVRSGQLPASTVAGLTKV